MAIVSFSRARRRLSIRYYLCTGLTPARIPLRLYRDLVSGKVRITKFSGTIQRVAEVLITSGPDDVRNIKIHAKIAHFTGEGRIDLSQAAESVSVAIEGKKPKRVGEKVIDIRSTLQFLKLESETTWRVTPAMSKAIRDDIAGTVSLPILDIKPD